MVVVSKQYTKRQIVFTLPPFVIIQVSEEDVLCYSFLKGSSSFVVFGNNLNNHENSQVGFRKHRAEIAPLHKAKGIAL